jgi:hypothetical protein
MNKTASHDMDYASTAAVKFPEQLVRCVAYKAGED